MNRHTSTDEIDTELARCRRVGETVALARVLSGRRAGARLLVWPAGQALGDLGSPRLNQRVALYAEGLLKRGGSESKLFDVPGGEIEIETTVYAAEESDA
jgi:hypothetical protein